MSIRVALTAPYDVHIGHGVREQLAQQLRIVAPQARTAVIVTTSNLRAQPWFDFTCGVETNVLEIPDGESAKEFSVVEELCREFSILGLSRHDVIVAVGGGATTDVVGFAAAIYVRGIAVIHVATSIAGQVDAAIGGKTAINLSTGKNLVGAFHQPRAVFCDLDAIATLPERELCGGMGEVAKVWILERRAVSDLPSTSLEDFVTIAVDYKARIVAADEFETSGIRALLNYGHTLGHAVENLTLAINPTAIRHGEAVAIGLRFAARLARDLGRCGDGEVAYTDAVVAHFGLSGEMPVPLPVDDIIAVMARDKKAHHSLTFVLPTDGEFVVVNDVPEDVVRATYASFTGGAL